MPRRRGERGAARRTRLQSTAVRCWRCASHSSVYPPDVHAGGGRRRAGLWRFFRESRGLATTGPLECGSSMRMFRACLLGLVATCVVPSPSFGQLPAAPIDRRALVTRHNPTLTRIDPASPLMVGNGNLGFTADITGLQTFQEQYSPLVPLMTQAQWAWHSFPNPENFRISQA